MRHTPGHRDLGTFVPDNLIAGDFPIRTREIVLSMGQDLKRGSILGRITETGEYVLSAKLKDDDTEISDGSEKPVAILVEDTDTTAKKSNALVYKTGDFSKHQVIFGKGHNFESAVDGLDDLNIYLTETIKGD